MKLRYIFAAFAGTVLAGNFVGLGTEQTEDSAPVKIKVSDPFQSVFFDSSGNAPLKKLHVLKAAPDNNNRAIPSSTTSHPKRQKNSAHTYNIGGKKITVGPRVKAAFSAVEKSHGIPSEVMIAVCARESDCIPERINPSSKACGLFQFMTNKTGTLYETLHKYGKANGYEKEAELIERYVRKRDKKKNPYYGYRPVSKAAKDKTLALCLDPTFNATMWAAYQKPNIDKYNKWLGSRTITAGEITAMNNLGLRGLQAFARQAWKDKKNGTDMLAVDFFKKHRKLFGGNMGANKTIIYHANGTYKTVRQAYADILSFGGYKEIKPIKAIKSIKLSSLTQ